MKLTLRAAGILLSMLVAPMAFSQNSNTINVVTSAVPFLRISPDARAGGMGDIGVATAPDANSSFWNGAKLPFIETKGGLSLTYTPWLKDLGLSDVYLACLAGYYKIDDQSAISSSIRYFNLGNIQFTDFSGNPLSTGKPTEVAIDLGYSRKLSSKWGVGAALRYINSNLARGYASSSGVEYKAGTTVAGDLTVYYNGTNDIGKGFRFGAAFTNLGGKISYTSNALEKDYIPANMGLGVSYTVAPDENNRVMFGVDINKLLVPTPPKATGDSATDANALTDYRNKGVVSSWFSSFGDSNEEFKELQFSVGAEYSYMQQFFVRAGYFYEDATKGNRQYFSAGVGLRFNVFGLDFSYLVPSGNGTNRNPLSNTLRFSLLFNFDGAK
jgi:hypothetical protein